MGTRRLRAYPDLDDGELGFGDVHVRTYLLSSLMAVSLASVTYDVLTKLFDDGELGLGDVVLENLGDFLVVDHRLEELLHLLLTHDEAFADVIAVTKLLVDL